MNRTPLEIAALATLFLLLVFALVRPLYHLGERGIRVPLEAAETRGTGVHLMSFSRSELWGKQHTSSQPQFNEDGSKLLVTREGEEGSELVLWTEGAGVEEIPLARGNIQASSIDASGQNVSFLRAFSPSESSPTASEANELAYSLGIWQQGSGTLFQEDVSFYGSWQMDISSDARRIVLLPASADSGFQRRGHEIRYGRGILFEKLPEGTWRNEDFERAFSADGLQVMGDATFSVLEMKSEASLLLRFRRRLSGAVFDPNRDGAEDLLSFQSVADGPPLWQSYSLSGFRGFTRRVSVQTADLGSWRLGEARSVPVVADYDGDGLLDLATYKPGFYPAQLGANHNWEIFFSREGGEGIHPDSRREISWGFGDMRAVPADYDGDGIADVAVVANASSRWHLLYSRGGFNRAKADLNQDSFFGEKIQWGLAGDCLVPGDYNADGCADLAVVRSEEAETASANLRWLIRYLPCRGERAESSEEVEFGKLGDIPLPADFDGDGALELAVFRPEMGRWYIRESDGNVRVVKWSVEDAQPFVGEFDGDKKADLAFYRARGPEHYYLRSSVISPEVTESLGIKSPGLVRLRWGSADSVPVQILNRQHRACH